MTPAAAGITGPTSARPTPSHSSAIPRCTTLAARSARLVVAVEHEAGCTGIPTAQFSRRWMLILRKLPAFGGTPAPMLLKTPTRAAVLAVDSVRLSPLGRQATLLRRATSIR